MLDAAAERSERRLLQFAIVWLVVMRVWMMATYPLTDTTEARYGELARVTAEGEFWLMPHLTPALPFWAKPPLSTWLVAGSYELFGFHEFVMRLPSLILAVLTAWLVWSVARDFGITRAGRWFSMATLMTAPIFVVAAGAVMTDATQMGVVAAAMVVSWRALREPHVRRWRLMFWALLGVAMLSKGPSTIALIGLPIAAYAVVGEGIATVCRRLWDVPGLLVAVAVSLAWYVPVELAYPGFLNYFVVGEHVRRFLEPGWVGDRYGNAHQETLGMIWAFWIAGIGTWTGVFVVQVSQLVRPSAPAVPTADRWLWCWILAPLIFFSVSQNVVMTYVLTAVPPYALAVGRWVESDRGWLRRVIPSFAIAIAAVTTIVGTTWLPWYLDTRSARTLVAVAHEVTPARELYVFDVYPYSANFYSQGTARRVRDVQMLNEVLSRPGALVIARLDGAAMMQNQPVRELGRNSLAVLLEVVERQ
jgi:4-amino-4-deoxy-L-arabinose transferase-like glycosyltransferase